MASIGAPRVLLTVVMVGMAVAHNASAQLFFHFVEDGADVTMTASGSIDTAQLVSFSAPGWGGRGIEENGESDIMGDNTLSPPIDTGFAFSSGTDFSSWASASGPFASDFFYWNGADTSTTTPFATYVSDSGRVPGLTIRGSDLDGSVWTPDSFWRASGETFASLGLQPGTYTVTDASTGAFITIQVGGALPVSTPAEPVPALPSAVLWLLAAVVGLFGARRRRQRA